MIIQGDPEYLAHASKYKGGFTKDGKNTSAYNHDYYMKNKEKWKDNDKNDGGIIETATDVLGNLLGYGYKEEAKKYAIASGEASAKGTGKGKIYQAKAEDAAKRYRWSTAYKIDNLRDVINKFQGKVTTHAKSVEDMINPESWKNNKADRAENYTGRKEVEYKGDTRRQKQLASSKIRKRVKGQKRLGAKVILKRD